MSLDELEMSLDSLLEELDLLENNNDNNNNIRNSLPHSMLQSPPPQTPPSEPHSLSSSAFNSRSGTSASNSGPPPPNIINNSSSSSMDNNMLNEEDSNFGRSRSGTFGTEPPKSVRARAPTLTSGRDRSRSKSVRMTQPPEFGQAICSHCNQTIGGEYTLALGKMYHREHFTCHSCSRELSDEFCQLNNNNFCVPCAQRAQNTSSSSSSSSSGPSSSRGRSASKSVYLPKSPVTTQCAKCNGAIVGECISALEKHWHVACLTCNQCRRQLEGEFYQDVNNPNTFICPVCAVSDTIVPSSSAPAPAPSSSQQNPSSTTNSESSGFKRRSRRASQSMVLSTPEVRERGMSQSIKQPRPTGLQKPACPKCSRPILGEHVLAFGKMWHEQCLTCSRCSTKLLGNCYEDQNGLYVCQPCKDRKNCSVCNRAITGQFINFPETGQAMHMECLPSKTCHTCQQPIKGTGIISCLNKDWHQNCFCCFNCGKKMNQDYYAKNNEPWCDSCINSQTCFTCTQPLSGPYIPYKGKNYHPQCFNCSKCHRAVSTSEFYDINSFPFCYQCAVSYQ